MPKRESDEVIEKLMNLPIGVMEKVLENASSGLIPIEIDGIIYRIPKPISDLIDSLYLMLKEGEVNEKKVD
tara:strand:+ start:444 stop:656 length:213 start_codon:yes stop_codon:yes gene_type:complete